MIRFIFLICAVLVISGCLQGLGDQKAFESRTRPPDLVAAAMNGRALDVERFVQAGANVDERWLGSVTPLMAAAVGDHYEIVEYLLRHGANKMLTNKAGDTALDIAIRSNAIKTIQILKR